MILRLTINIPEDDTRLYWKRIGQALWEYIETVRANNEAERTSDVGCELPNLCEASDGVTIYEERLD